MHLSGGTLLQSVMSHIQLFYGTVHKFHKMLLFVNIIISPSTFIFRYVMSVRAKIVHAIMIELDQPD